mmetsp:Transcript_15403/g.33097  ORF Transcript_15403/g.33097 Transcript_15403/m.33097 type:complete len:540 (-) Transcript_15403:309-1928(-)
MTLHSLRRQINDPPIRKHRHQSTKVPKVVFYHIRHGYPRHSGVGIVQGAQEPSRRQHLRERILGGLGMVYAPRGDDGFSVVRGLPGTQETQRYFIVWQRSCPPGGEVAQEHCLCRRYGSVLDDIPAYFVFIVIICVVVGSALFLDGFDRGAYFIPLRSLIFDQLEQRLDRHIQNRPLGTEYEGILTPQPFTSRALNLKIGHLRLPRSHGAVLILAKELVPLHRCIAVLHQSENSKDREERSLVLQRRVPFDGFPQSPKQTSSCQQQPPAPCRIRPYLFSNHILFPTYFPLRNELQRLGEWPLVVIGRQSRNVKVPSVHMDLQPRVDGSPRHPHLHLGTLGIVEYSIQPRTEHEVIRHVRPRLEVNTHHGPYPQCAHITLALARCLCQRGLAHPAHDNAAEGMLHVILMGGEYHLGEFQVESGVCFGSGSTCFGTGYHGGGFLPFGLHEGTSIEGYSSFPSYAVGNIIVVATIAIPITIIARHGMTKWRTIPLIPILIPRSNIRKTSITHKSPHATITFAHDIQSDIQRRPSSGIHRSGR